MITTRAPRERAYLIGVLLPGSTEESVREQMLELTDLARTAGAEVVGSDVQRRSQIDARHYIGMGKVEELRLMRLEGGYDVIVCNEDLSPRQQRNLELELKTRVLDRTEVILEIFAQHARTHEGRLQVEAARLHHLLPRLTMNKLVMRPAHRLLLEAFAQQPGDDITTVAEQVSLPKLPLAG